MDARFAEDIVRKWQNIKSQAFGPDHCLAKLPEVTKYITCMLLVELLLEHHYEETSVVLFF